jgi:transposase
VARLAESDRDALLLMSIPGIDFFTALALKSRIGDIARFPTKKHLCSYGAVVPEASNSGEYVSRHNRVKHGDMMRKKMGNYSRVRICAGYRDIFHRSGVVDFC